MRMMSQNEVKQICGCKLEKTIQQLVNKIHLIYLFIVHRTACGGRVEVWTQPPHALVLISTETGVSGGVVRITLLSTTREKKIRNCSWNHWLTDRRTTIVEYMKHAFFVTYFWPNMWGKIFQLFFIFHRPMFPSFTVFSCKGLQGGVLTLWVL